MSCGEASGRGNRSETIPFAPYRFRRTGLFAATRTSGVGRKISGKILERNWTCRRPCAEEHSLHLGHSASSFMHRTLRPSKPRRLHRGGTCATE